MYPDGQQSSTTTSLSAENEQAIAQLEQLVAAGQMDRSTLLFARRRLQERPLDKLFVHIRPDSQTGFWYTISTDDPARIGAETEAWLKALSNPQPGDFTSEDYARAGSYVGADGILRTPIEESYDEAGEAAPLESTTNTAAATVPQPREEASYTPQPMWKGDLIDKEKGLRARTAAEAVLSMGPLRLGMDGRFWAFENGVWVPGDRLFHARVVQLLDEDFRSAHKTNIRGVLEGKVEEIHCTPVEQYINFRNGMVDWQTEDFYVHNPDIPSTVQMQVDWHPGIKCPNFEAFLAQILGEEDVRRVWELIGYLLMSGNPLQKAFLFKGQGRNGKGALMRTVEKLIGKQHISNISLHDLASNRFAPAGLYGMTANICGDIDAAYVENTALFKQITGQDTIEAERKGIDRFRFKAWAVPVFSANSIPGSADTSSGWVDRWEVIHFGTNLSGKEDRTVEQRMQTDEELRGIAVKAIAALRDLMERGRFEDTESSKKAKQEFQENSNPVAAWLADQIRADAAWIPRTAAWTSFKQWAEEARYGGKMSRNRFYDAIRNQGVMETTRSGTIGFAGIALAGSEF